LSGLVSRVLYALKARGCHLSAAHVAVRLKPPAEYAGPAPRLPLGSPANREQRFVGNGRRASAYGVAPDRVYICTQLPAVPVSFYLAFPSVPAAMGQLR